MKDCSESNWKEHKNHHSYFRIMNVFDGILQHEKKKRFLLNQQKGDMGDMGRSPNIPPVRKCAKSRIFGQDTDLHQARGRDEERERMKTKREREGSRLKV